MVLSKAEELELREIAKRYNISTDEAKEIISGMYTFIREKVVSLEFKDTKYTREEFDKIKTNFNLPCIGKLCASYYNYSRINKLNNKDGREKDSD